MKQSTKTGLLIGATVMTLATGVLAANGACGGGTGTSITGTSGSFIVTGFTPQCSAATYVDFNQTATQVGVCGLSSKGDTKYGGGSGGGGVSSITTVSTGTTTVTATSSGC